jgi:ubiquinone/menaquinone biosynthesis C-methylase UbiE
VCRRTPVVQVLAGNGSALPLPDESADAAWFSLVIQHVPDLGVAAHEIRRLLRPGAPVLIRQGFPDRYEPLARRIELLAETHPQPQSAESGNRSEAGLERLPAKRKSQLDRPVPARHCS